jgi:hypothetical protein
MSSLDQLAPRQPQIEGLEAAKIIATPASISDDVFVILEGMPEQPFGPVLGWRSAPEAGWPQKGAPCAVMTAPDGTAWLVGWDRP